MPKQDGSIRIYAAWVTIAINLIGMVTAVMVFAGKTMYAPAGNYAKQSAMDSVAFSLREIREDMAETKKSVGILIEMHLRDKEEESREKPFARRGIGRIYRMAGEDR